jgi:hypothetical protein
MDGAAAGILATGQGDPVAVSIWGQANCPSKILVLQCQLSAGYEVKQTRIDSSLLAF